MEKMSLTNLAADCLSKGEPLMAKELTGIITWHEIGPNGPANIPDAGKEILIYDGFLDDVVKGYMSIMPDGETPAWIDLTTDDQLHDPQWWTDVPFPGEGQR